jgi:sigma-E factor negative regulatory protein RseC
MGLEETGVVVSVDGQEAQVRIIPSGACASCPSSAICGPAGDEKITTAINPVGARPGDNVRIVMHARMYLKGTFLVYGLPVLLLIAGGILGKEWAERYRPLWDADLVAAAVGFGLMVSAFIVVRHWGKKVEQSRDYLPVIEGLLSPEEAARCGSGTDPGVQPGR